MGSIRWVRRGLGVLMAAVLAACGDGTGSPPDQARVPAQVQVKALDDAPEAGDAAASEVTAADLADESTQPSQETVSSPGAEMAVQAADVVLQPQLAQAGGQRAAMSSLLAFDARSQGAHAWVVNPDNDSVSLIDVRFGVRIAEISVGRGPRSLAVAPDGRVWVSNRDAASVSVIDPERRQVVATHALPRASQPWGIVVTPDGSAWVVLSAFRQLVRLDASGTVRDAVPIRAHARQISTDPTGARLFVSRFITPPMPGESTARVRARRPSGERAGAQIEVVDAAARKVVRTIVLGFSAGPDTADHTRGVPNYLGAMAISPDGRRAWVPSKQDNLQRGALRDGQPLDFQTTVRAVTSEVDLDRLVEVPAARIHHDDAGYAAAATFEPSGRYVFVALESSRAVAVIDTTQGIEVERMAVGIAPQAVAVSPDGRWLLVHNFMDRTVSVFALERRVTATVMPPPSGLRVVPLHVVRTVAQERLAPDVLLGKQLFHDAGNPRMARDGYMVCSVCHNEGGHDGRTWDFTSLGEGLRNTQSLEGRRGGQGRLHWTGNFDEIQDFEAAIRGLAGGTGLMAEADWQQGTRSQGLGDRKAGVSRELDALAAYVQSLQQVAPSPFRQPDGTLTDRARDGAALFQSKGCTDCHGGADYTASARLPLLDIGTLRAPTSGQRMGATLTGIDVQTLRDAWSTAPYLHDGSARTLEAAIRAHRNLEASDLEVRALARFVAEIGDGEAMPDTSAQVAVPRVREALVEATVSGVHVVRQSGGSPARLWIGGQLILDGIQPDRAAPGRVRLSAGERYLVRLEQPAEGSSWPRVLWRRPGDTRLTEMPLSAP